MIFNKDDVRRDLYSGKDKGFSHLVVLLDRWDYDYLTVYISENENIDEVLKQYIYNDSLWVIVEIYNYDMDLEFQLQEEKAMHKVSTKEYVSKFCSNLTNRIRDNNPLIDFISSLGRLSGEEIAFFNSLESELRAHQKRLKK